MTTDENHFDWERDLLENGPGTHPPLKVTADWRISLLRDYRGLSRPVSESARIRSILDICGIEIPALDVHSKPTVKFLAQLLGKDAKSIKLYCQQGLVPGAFKTKGGHWRIAEGRFNLETLKKRLGKVKQRNCKNWRNLPMWEEAAEKLRVASLVREFHFVFDTIEPERVESYTPIKFPEEMPEDLKIIELMIAWKKLDVYFGTGANVSGIAQRHLINPQSPTNDQLAETMQITPEAFRLKYSDDEIEEAKRLAGIYDKSLLPRADRGGRKDLVREAASETDIASLIDKPEEIYAEEHGVSIAVARKRLGI